MYVALYNTNTSKSTTLYFSFYYLQISCQSRDLIF